MCTHAVSVKILIFTPFSSFVFQILEEQRHYLCKHLNPQDHFAYLRSKHLLTREDEELIKSEVTSKRRAERFLDILVQKGPNCYKSLVDALLKNGTQLFLAEKLNKEYERKKINLHSKMHYVLNFLCEFSWRIRHTVHVIIIKKRGQWKWGWDKIQ